MSTNGDLTNGTMPAADDAASASPFDESMVAFEENDSAMPTVQKRMSADNDEETDTLSSLKMRSSSMPNRDGATQIDRRIVSTGLPMPQTSALTIASHPLPSLPSIGSTDGSELQKAIAQARRRLGETFSAEIVASVADLKMSRLQRHIVDTRMRLMPHQNSRVDRYLKKAELFAKSIATLSNMVIKIDSRGDEAARLVWRCLEIILSDKSDAAILERIFAALDEVAEIIQYIGRDRGLEAGASKLVYICVRALATVLNLCVDVTVLFKTANNRIQVFFFEFEYRFRRYISILYECRVSFSGDVWDGWLGGDWDISILKIRRWLSGYDRTIFDDYTRIIGGRIARYEITCEWVTRTLRDFVRSSDNLLMLTGPAGCGKSFAMGSILDYARVNMRQKTFKLLKFSIDPFSPLRRSAIHLVKNLLLQLLDQSVGDVTLLKALCDAYKRIEEKHESSSEEILWKIFSETIQRQKDETIIVIDGMDKIEGGWAVSIRITALLQKLMMIRRSVRCIILSRPFDCDLPVGFPVCIYIPDRHGDDIKRFIQAFIVRLFGSFTVQHRQELLIRIMERTIFSYVEVQLLFTILAREKTYEKVCILLKQIPRALSGLVGFICQSLDRNQPQIVALFSVLLVAQRPLQLEELRRFLDTKEEKGLQLGAEAFRERIRKLTGGLVDVSGSQVHFINSEVRQIVVELCVTKRFFVDISTAHSQISIRCMAIIKDALKETSQQIIFKDSLDNAAATLFQSKVAVNSLLEYSVRYYLVHYLKSGRKDSGSVLLSTDLKAALSDSVLAVIVERRWWERQFGTIECERMLEQALRLRRAAFGSQAKCVLQNAIELAAIRRKLGRFSSAILVYYEAWQVAIKVYGEYDSFCLSIAEAFIALCGSISNFEVDFSVEVERIYLYLYRSKKHHGGDFDHGCLHYGDLLVEFYLRLQRHQQACTIRREIYEILIRTYGALHETTQRYAQLLIKLLEILGEHDEIIIIRETICGAAGAELHPWDVIRIRITLEFIESCEARGAYKQAEVVFRALWDALFAVCVDRVDDAVDRGFTDITLRFATFLKLRGSLLESKRLLLVLWREVYSGSIRRLTCPSDIVLINLRKIGELLLSYEEYHVSMDLMTLLRGWYISTGRRSHQEVIYISVILSKCCHHTGRNDDAEGTLGSLFDDLIDGEFIHAGVIDICIQLLISYEKTSQWHAAIEVCKRALSRFWMQLFLSDHGGCDLPNEFTDEAIDIALRLAIFYFKVGNVSEAERIRILVFRACRRSWSIEDIRLIQTTERLCLFYEQIGKIDAALETWRELQELALSRLGRQSEIYIKISYYIARLTRKHGHPGIEDILRDIILGFGRGYEGCGHGSIEAVIELIRFYEEQNKFENLRRWYQYLFMAFRMKGHGCGLSGESFFAYYLRYMELLKKEKEITLAIDIARKFRATCLSMYGVRSIISIRALFQLASVLEMESTCIEESIRLYEEICGFKGAFSQEIILQIFRLAQSRLVVLYCGGKGNPKKAEQMLIIIWKETVVKYGYASDVGLEYLSQLIKFYAEQRSIEIAFSYLESTVLEILRRERDNARLFAASKHLFAMFKLIECRIKALDFLATLRIEFNGGKRGGRLTDVDRQSFILILALEELLNGKDRATLYTDVLQDLMMETMLYEKWVRICASGDLDMRLSVGAQLLAFLERKGRKAEVIRITEQLWLLFAVDVNVTTEKSGVLYEFFVVCIGEMKQAKTFKLIETAITKAIAYAKECKFQACYDLSVFVHSYVIKRGGWAFGGRAASGFKLATTLSAHRTSGGVSVILVKKMDELAQQILSQVLEAGLALDFDGLTRWQLHIICMLLGQLKNWSNLKLILERLWESRMQSQWGYRIIVQIGMRLCEARYVSGEVVKALSLLEDIRYNTSDALGPLHQLTLDCDKLRSRLYTSAGKHSSAVELHTSILRQINRAQEDGIEDYIYSSDDEGFSGRRDLSTVGFDHARLLKLSVQRHGSGCWKHDNGQKDELAEVLRDVKDQFAGSEDHWHDIDPGSLDLWASHGEEVPKSWEFGCWEPPNEWGFLSGADTEDDEGFTLGGDVGGDSLLGGISTGGAVYGFDTDRNFSSRTTSGKFAADGFGNEELGAGSLEFGASSAEFGASSGLGESTLGFENLEVSRESFGGNGEIVPWEGSTFRMASEEQPAMKSATAMPHETADDTFDDVTALRHETEDDTFDTTMPYDRTAVDAADDSFFPENGQSAMGYAASERSTVSTGAEDVTTRPAMPVSYAALAPSGIKMPTVSVAEAFGSSEDGEAMPTMLSTNWNGDVD